MGSSALARVMVEGDEGPKADSGVPRHLRIRFEGGTWRLTEDGANRIGGRFASLSSAVDFARGELHGVRGGCVVLELGVAGDHGRP
jgi:hypothetical protein